MQTKTIHEGTVSFEGVVGIERQAFSRAVDAAERPLRKSFYQSMRPPLISADYGVRARPEKLGTKTASAFAGRVNYELAARTAAAMNQPIAAPVRSVEVQRAIESLHPGYFIATNECEAPRNYITALEAKQSETSGTQPISDRSY
ncbi:hypothetical protein [Bradyrhizobium sp. SYSU BS000235]|uniref:hypothetical protein n=1 Tax=Bradyrhizobium sp. SYSU BS000235 TaxID=3411332 RepID=UPI003C7396B2